MDQVREIAKTKAEDLNANDIEQAAKIIAGTARSMGITVQLIVRSTALRGRPARPRPQLNHSPLHR